MKNPFVYILSIMMFMTSVCSCEKFLEPKPLQSIAVPNSLKDLQALLDDQNLINSLDITAGDISSDDYYLTLSDFNSLSTEENRRMYKWEKDNIFSTINDWSLAYKVVYSTNVVLNNIENIEINSQNQNIWNNVKGQALFIRAKQFLSIALVWAPVYSSNSSNDDLGIPLRLDEDFNKKSVRSSLKETYLQITEDLKLAASLLNEIPLSKTRASKPAAYGLLARTYLAMSKFDSCFKYTDLYLKKNHELLDYNTDIIAAQNSPFKRLNKEVCYDSFGINMMFMTGIVKVDTNLYESYNNYDIRKEAFFMKIGTGVFTFKGHYSYGNFGGIATDEVFLMRAECYARNGNISKALTDLNKLLINRWRNEHFVPYISDSSEEVLQMVLTERRKELLFRGLRFMDLKRLNKEGMNIRLIRKLGDHIYYLEPNDKKYALSIPEDVISLSNMPQNIR